MIEENEKLKSEKKELIQRCSTYRDNIDKKDLEINSKNQELNQLSQLIQQNIGADKKLDIERDNYINTLKNNNEILVKQLQSCQKLNEDLMNLKLSYKQEDDSFRKEIVKANYMPYIKDTVRGELRKDSSSSK